MTEEFIFCIPRLRSFAGLSSSSICVRNLDQLASSASARKWSIFPVVSGEMVLSHMSLLSNEYFNAALRGLCVDYNVNFSANIWDDLGAKLANIPHYIRFPSLQQEWNLRVYQRMSLRALALKLSTLKVPVCVPLRVWNNAFEKARQCINECQLLKSEYGLNVTFEVEDCTPELNELLERACDHDPITVMLSFTHAMHYDLARQLGVSQVVAAIDYVETVMVKSIEASSTNSIWDDVGRRGMRGLVQRLRSVGFSEQDIRYMCCDNFIRLFEVTLCRNR